MPSSTKQLRRRGRPPAYDRDAALTAIRDTFWHRGFSATSLDDIAFAAGMNRPSLYGAFGDKRDMYLAALRAFSAELSADMREALNAPTLASALDAFFMRAIKQYVSGKVGPRGCLVLCTAATEAVEDSTIRSTLAEMLADLDSMLTARIARAQTEGDRCIELSPQALARTVTAVLHSLAIRARAGMRRSELISIARTAARLVVGPDVAGSSCGTR